MRGVEGVHQHPSVLLADVQAADPAKRHRILGLGVARVPVNWSIVLESLLLLELYQVLLLLLLLLEGVDGLLLL